jgi:hypothetical protein
MIVEEVFHKKNTPPSQRRPHGHVKTGVTKKGNKKRGLRARTESLLDDEVADVVEEDEDGWIPGGGRPPALTMSLFGWMNDRYIVSSGQARWPLHALVGEGVVEVARI